MKQNLTLNFSGIDARGYATVGVGGAYGQVSKFEGDITGSNSRIRINARNKVWERYLRMSGAYSRRDTKSWITAISRNSNSLSFKASSKYLSKYLTKYLNPRGNGRSSLILTTTDRESENNFGRKRSSSTKEVELGHTRTLFRGPLNASLIYRNDKSKADDITRNTTKIALVGTYSKRLLRRIGWKTSAKAHISKKQKLKTSGFSISNGFRYRLRLWSLHAKHSYSLTKYSNSKVSTNLVLLTASRSFMRVF